MIDYQKWRKTLQDVQARVNTDCSYATDELMHGVADFWDVMGLKQVGDCEDYALEKRCRLRRLGIDWQDLRLATCWTETGAYHAVLVAVTDFGDLVLDNRYWSVTLWSACNYTWHLMQDATGAWREVVKQ